MNTVPGAMEIPFVSLSLSATPPPKIALKIARNLCPLGARVRPRAGSKAHPRRAGAKTIRAQRRPHPAQQAPPSPPARSLNCKPPVPILSLLLCAETKRQAVCARPVRPHSLLLSAPLPKPFSRSYSLQVVKKVCAGATKTHSPRPLPMPIAAIGKSHPPPLCYFASPPPTRWAPPRRFLLAINYDRPFLVDTTHAACAEVGVAVRLLLHPVFAVERDSQGKLTKILNPQTKHKTSAKKIAPQQRREARVAFADRTLTRGSRQNGKSASCCNGCLCRPHPSNRRLAGDAREGGDSGRDTYPSRRQDKRNLLKLACR